MACQGAPCTATATARSRRRTRAASRSTTSRPWVRSGAPSSSSTSIGSWPARPRRRARIEHLGVPSQTAWWSSCALAGVVDRPGANAFLAMFLPRYNARFVVPALDPVPAWRTLPDDVELDRVLVFKYRRKVARDRTVTIGGVVLQLPPGATGAANYAGRRVEVHVALDGSMVAYDGRRRLAVRAAPPTPVQLRAASATGRAEPESSIRVAAVDTTPRSPLEWVPPGSKLEKRLTESLGS